MRPKMTMTFRASSESGGSLPAADAQASRSRANHGFGQGPRRLRRLWRNTYPVIVTLTVFAVLTAASMAIRIAIWVPLHRVMP